ncbi:MAG: hypothetical protein LJE68_15425 [Rhodobacter sp.]|nr:hypothetical protein [Rhodobacter sp.]
MNLLIALIAFSIVMIVSSTLVIALVRLLQEFRRLRQRHMRYMLSAVFDEYLWPEFGRIAAALPQQLTRRKSTTYTAGQELKPERGFWASMIAALDLWTILWDAVRKHDQKPTTHDWKSGNFTMIAVVLWVLILAFSIYCIARELFFPLFLLSIAIFFAVDWAREIDRDRFAIWSEMDADKAKLMKALDTLKQEGGGAPLTVAGLAESPQFASKSADEVQELLNEYQRLTRRRAFVDEIMKVSRAVAANEGRAETAEQEEITVIDFISHLGRTEFGEAIRRVALAQKDMTEARLADMINRILDDAARRYDTLSKQSTAQFRDVARRWSIGLAFVVALTANVDAPFVFQTLYENPEISASVETQFGERVAAMSTLEAKLVADVASAEAAAAEAAKAEAETPQAVQDESGAADETPTVPAPETDVAEPVQPSTPDAPPATDPAAEAKQEVARLRAQLSNVRAEFASTTDELAALGVPVGWGYFPFCKIPEGRTFILESDFKDIRDSRCQSLIRDMVGKSGGRPISISLSSLFETRMAGGRRGEPGTPKLPVTTGTPDQQSSFTSIDKAAPPIASGDLVPAIPIADYPRRLWNYAQAAADWIMIRLPHGLTIWFVGAILGGALIGLGGPFWFDIYKRLSSIAQIARAAGLVVRRQPPPAVERANGEAPAPEHVHQPKNIYDAFNTALNVQMQINRAKQLTTGFEVYAAMTEETDESGEVAVPPTPGGGPQ